MDIIHATEQDFDGLLQKNSLALVDFWATWCGPCRMVGPIMEQLAKIYDGKLAVIKVDVDENEELASRFGIQSIPTVLLFRDGKLVRQDVGAHPQAFYQQIIDSTL